MARYSSGGRRHGESLHYSFFTKQPQQKCRRPTVSSTPRAAAAAARPRPVGRRLTRARYVLYFYKIEFGGRAPVRRGAAGSRAKGGAGVCGADKDTSLDGKPHSNMHLSARAFALGSPFVLLLQHLNIANTSSSSHSTGISDSSFASGPLPPVLEITTSQ